MFSIKSQNEPIKAVCKITNANGSFVYRILTEALAKQWNEQIVFTGDQQACIRYMSDNKLPEYKEQ